MHFKVWLIICIVLAILLAAIFGTMGVHHAARKVPIHEVIVSGNFKQIDETKLRNILTPLINKKDFFSINLSAIQAQVQQIPWVEDADVTRIWPDKLQVAIQAQQAMAVWNQAGLVNRYGEIFYPAHQTFPAALPAFFAPSVISSLSMLDNYQQIQAVLDSVGLKVAILKVNDDQSWQVTLTNGTNLQLGKTQTLTRLRRFVKVYSKVFTLKNSTRKKHAKQVDLRYNHGMAIQWH